MIARFDFYDFVANLIPGLVFLWCMQMLTGLFGCTLALDFTGGLTETSILVALGYITGLLLQGFSQSVVERRILKPLWSGFPSERWLLPEENHFTTGYKTSLLTLIRERFNVTTDPDLPPVCEPEKSRDLRMKKNRELFYLVYHRVGESSPRPLTFNAQYGLFRVLLTMFGLLAVLSLAGIIWTWSCQPDKLIAFTVWCALSIAAMLIGYFRCKKRGEDFAQSVYDLFMAKAGSIKAESEETT